MFKAALLVIMKEAMTCLSVGEQKNKSYKFPPSNTMRGLNTLTRSTFVNTGKSKTHCSIKKIAIIVI